MKQGSVEDLWEHLHWLTVLYQQGSFSKAAARLGVSKASMSQHIAELEKAAGIALVQRTTRSTQLTAAGHELVESTRGAFAQIATGFANVRDLAGVPRGVLRVTAPVAFSRQQLVPRLPEFLRAYPDIRLELDMSDRIRALAQDGFDLAVRHTGAPPETHVAWTLAPTRTVLAASRAYLRTKGDARGATRPVIACLPALPACRGYANLDVCPCGQWGGRTRATGAGRPGHGGGCRSDGRQQQRSLAGRCDRRAWHCAAAGFHRAIRAGDGPAHRGTSRLEGHRCFRGVALRNPTLLRARVARLAGVRRVPAPDLFTGIFLHPTEADLVFEGLRDLDAISRDISSKNIDL